MRKSLPRRWRIASLCAATAILGTTAVVVRGTMDDAPRAKADTSPPAGMPATFSSTPLPTVQVNGIVWAQVTLGNTVYVTGNFTTTRPAGAAPNTNTTPAGNLMAYDITTGERIMSFNVSLDRAGRSLALSPDGTRLYVGGDFKKVNGVDRPGIIAIRTSDGTVDPTFLGKTGSTVMAIAPTSTGIYVGGSFVTAGTLGTGTDIPRSNLAAFDLNGNLQPWAPTATGGIVKSMVLAPGGAKVVVAGQFTHLNSLLNRGMGAVDATSGATLPWVSNTTIRNSNPSSIEGLSTDGTLIYGGGASWGGNSNFEGRFGLNPADGSIVWANDCHGDTYTTLPVNGALYSTGHAHDCSWVGSYPDYHAVGGKWKNTMAETVFPTGTNKGPDNYGWNYNGVPSSTVLTWFPSLTMATKSLASMPAGTVAISGAAQAGWSLATNSNGSYLSVGGEFTQANYKPQQGLVRYAMTSAAPSTSGPIFESVVAPSVTDAGSGTARVTWGAGWDRDNELLTYEVFRDNATTPLTKQVMSSLSWNTTAAGSLVDTGLSAGSHSYTLKVTDPDGNWVKKTSTVLIGTTGTSPAATTNVSRGKPTSMSGLFGAGYESWRAVDGNTDGRVNQGSSSITLSTAGSWWQVDLGANLPLQSVDIAGRTDCCTDQSGDLYVYVSSDPLDMRLSPSLLASRPGVWSTYVAAGATPTLNVPFPANTTGRYVMVRHGSTNHLSLAEVTVTGTPPAPPVVDTLAPNQVTGVTATQNGTAVDVAWAATTDLPDPGGVGINGYWVIRDFSTQWFVSGGALTYKDTTVPVGNHKYQVRAVDKGGRIGPVSATVNINVTDPNAIVDTLAPNQVTGVTATQNGVTVDVAWAATTDLPDPGGVGIHGYYVIRDFSTQWLVTGGALTFNDSTVPFGTHKYQVRAVDKGGRIGPASATITINVIDPNAIVDTLAPNQVTGVTATQNGTAVDVAWAATTDLPDPGGVGVSGYWVIRDFVTQWRVNSPTLTFSDTTVTPGSHKYQVRAVDAGGRIGPASTTLTIVVV